MNHTNEIEMLERVGRTVQELEDEIAHLKAVQGELADTVRNYHMAHCDRNRMDYSTVQSVTDIIAEATRRAVLEGDKK